MLTSYPIANDIESIASSFTITKPVTPPKVIGKGAQA